MSNNQHKAFAIAITMFMAGGFLGVVGLGCGAVSYHRMKSRDMAGYDAAESKKADSRPMRARHAYTSPVAPPPAAPAPSGAHGRFAPTAKPGKRSGPGGPAREGQDFGIGEEVPAVAENPVFDWKHPRRENCAPWWGRTKSRSRCR